MRHDFPLQQLYWLFPKNDVPICLLILLGLVSNNLAWCSNQTWDQTWSGLWHQLQRVFFKAGVVFASFPSCAETAFHSVQKMAGTTPHDCLPRKDQHGLESLYFRPWNLTFVTFYFLFVLIFRLRGEQWLPFQSIRVGLSLHQAKTVFTKKWANWDCVLFKDKVLPALHFVWQLRLWTSNICARVFFLMEREAELWAAGAVRVLQIADPLHCLFFLNHLSSKLKNQTNVDYPPVEEDSTFSWYKSEQLQRRFSELRIWPLSHSPVTSVDQ